MPEGKGVPAVAVIGALVVAAMAIGYWLSGGGGGNAPADLEAQRRDAELRDKDKERSERVALARVSQQHAVDVGTRALELLEVSLKEEGRWRTEVEPLLSNQQGRVLASDDVLIDGFIQVYDARRPQRSEIEAARPRIEVLLKEPSAALADPSSTYQPAQALLDGLERECAALEQVASSYKRSREKVESLLAAAKLNNTAPGGIPLEQAIADRRARDVLAAAEADADRKARHQLEEAQKQAELDEALHKQRLAAMEAANAQQQKALDQKAETDRQLIAERAKREKLLALANDPAVQARFAPFLTRAHYILGCNFYHLPCRYDRPQPESYRALQRMEVFEDLKKLGFFASRTDKRNDRPTWRKPQTEEDWAQLEADQKLFAELAPIWVEQGKLAP